MNRRHFLINFATTAFSLAGIVSHTMPVIAESDNLPLDDGNKAALPPAGGSSPLVTGGVVAVPFAIGAELKEDVIHLPAVRG